MTWVYDIVINEDGKVVALNYHPKSPEIFHLHPNCLADANSKMQLKLEGFQVDMSLEFNSLQEARAHAWTNKDKFAEGLD